MKTAGDKRIRTLAQRASRALASCVLALGLMVPVGAACADASDASTGPAAQVAPQAVYANSLFSKMAGTVQYVSAQVGSTLRLSGDFQGGWGAVTFTWSAAEGNVSSGQPFGSLVAASLRTAPDEVFSQVESLAVEGRAPADATVLDTQDDLDAQGFDAQEQDVFVESFGWRVLGTVTIPGQLPNLNTAVVPQGLSQTIELSDLQEGRYALCLTAQDEVGDQSQIYWNVDVQEGTSSADTNVHLLVNPTEADLQPDDGSSQAPSTSQAVWRMPSQQTTASANADNANPFKATFPQTGDALGTVVVLAASIAVAAVWLLSWAVLRRKGKRRS